MKVNKKNKIEVFVKIAILFWQGQKDLVSPAGSVGASAYGRGVHWTPAPHDTLRVPRGKLSTHMKQKTDTARCLFFAWQGQKDLNPRHAVLETAALPTELYP